VYVHETYAYEVIAEELKIKLVIKNKLFQELEDFIKEVGSGGEVDLGVYPDSFYSCRYYLIGIYKSLCP
jgi:hypothetical protein